MWHDSSSFYRTNTVKALLDVRLSAFDRNSRQQLGFPFASAVQLILSEEEHGSR
jgi:hypothetical protein